MYATALDTVALAKVTKVWPDYIASSDFIILRVVREIENEMASFLGKEPNWVAEEYKNRTRDAMVELRGVGYVLGKMPVGSGSSIVSKGRGKPGGF
jgi:hypothetical protein